MEQLDFLLVFTSYVTVGEPSRLAAQLRQAPPHRKSTFHNPPPLLEEVRERKNSMTGSRNSLAVAAAARGSLDLPECPFILFYVHNLS